MFFILRKNYMEQLKKRKGRTKFSKIDWKNLIDFKRLMLNKYFQR